MRYAVLVCALAALPAAAQQPGSLTDEECLAFARAFEAEVAAGDLESLAARFDWDALLDRVTADPGGALQPGFVRGFRRGFKGAVLKPDKFLPVIVNTVAKGGGYKLLRVHEKQGGKRALFRLLLPDDGGVNYHDLILARSADGSVRAVDLYAFLPAENLSVTLRRMFLPLAAEASKGFLAKLLTSESEFVKHFEDIRRMSTLLRRGKPKQALRVYRSLPESVRKDKNVLLARVRAAQQIGDEENLAAIEAFRKQFPGDPVVDLLSIDLHIIRKRHAEALACVDRMEEAVGGDPYTDNLRGNIHYDKGDLDAAVRFARKAIAAEPTLQDAYWTVVQVSLDKKAFGETVRWMNKIEKVFQLEFGDLSKFEAYAEFVKSPEYREWKKKG